MNTIAHPTFRPTNNIEIVASEVRGELAKNNIRVSHLPRMLGNSREYWRRRITDATVALDIADLSAIADMVNVDIAYLVRNTKNAPQPQGPEGVNEKLPELDSNQQPAGFKPVTYLPTIPANTSDDNTDTLHTVTALWA